MRTKKGSAVGLEWVETRVPNYQRMKKFYRHTLGSSKTYLALLDTRKTGMTRYRGFVPTFEVPDLHKFISSMKKKRVRVGRRIVEGDHVRLGDFYDPNSNLLQAFQWKKTH